MSKINGGNTLFPSTQKSSENLRNEEKCWTKVLEPKLSLGKILPQSSSNIVAPRKWASGLGWTLRIHHYMPSPHGGDYRHTFHCYLLPLQLGMGWEDFTYVFIVWNFGMHQNPHIEDSKCKFRTPLPPSALTATTLEIPDVGILSKTIANNNGTCIIFSGFLSLIILETHPAYESLKPQRVYFQSRNFHNILHWQPGRACASNNNIYFVQYKM